MQTTTVKEKLCGWERATGLMDSKYKLHEPNPHSFFYRIRELALNKQESEQNYKIPSLNVHLRIKQCNIFVYSVGGKLRLEKYLNRPARIIIIIITHKGKVKFRAGAFYSTRAYGLLYS
jgi:hypothetical protein